MKNFIKNYKSTIILLLAIIIGSVVGIFLSNGTIGNSEEIINTCSLLGDIFLNLLFVIIVPLIFLNVTTAITKMEKPKRLGKIVVSILVVS